MSRVYLAARYSRREEMAEVAGQLREHAVEFRERAVAPAVSDKEGVPILNWAFLVPCESVGDFRATVQRITATHAEHGVVLDCSGPWPSYSFCPSLEAEGAE